MHSLDVKTCYLIRVGHRGEESTLPININTDNLAAGLPAVQKPHWYLRPGYWKYYNCLSYNVSFIISYTVLHCSEFMPLNYILFMLLSTLYIKTSARANSNDFRSWAKAAWCLTAVQYSPHTGLSAGVCSVQLKSLKKPHLCCTYCAYKD